MASKDMHDLIVEDLPDFLGLDLDKVKLIIGNSKDLKGDEQFFEAMSAMSFAKQAVKDVLDQVESYERDAKQQINDRAKALYGKDWQVIEGEHFKISRSATGSVYELIDSEAAAKVDPNLIKVAMAVDAKVADTYRESHDNKVPNGIAVNEHRGERIMITVR